jgi:hypothetical protein
MRPSETFRLLIFRLSPAPSKADNTVPFESTTPRTALAVSEIFAWNAPIHEKTTWRFSRPKVARDFCAPIFKPVPDYSPDRDF